MAAIDKIYGTQKQWIQLYSFLKKSRKYQYLKFLYPSPTPESLDAPLSNFSEEADIWLIQNCQLDFVKDRLKEQYGDRYDRFMHWCKKEKGM